jgi:predicted membrane chloride channel (bestrophin family)
MHSSIDVKDNGKASMDSFIQDSMHNMHTEKHAELFKFSGSVIPKIIIPCTMYTLWATLWVILHQLKVATFITQLAIPPLLITILGVVMGLLLVFRTNTACTNV